MISTRLTELLGIRHPIVQAAMGYVSGPRLAAATSDAGGLGLIASATMSLAELEGANSREFDATTRHPVVDLMDDQNDVVEKGGTMRLGSYSAELLAGSQVAKARSGGRPSSSVITWAASSGLIGGTLSWSRLSVRRAAGDRPSST